MKGQITHFPIVLLLVGFAMLIWSYRGEAALRNASLYILIAAAISAGLAVVTGDAAEETAERLPGVTKSLIRAHEEAAELAMWIAVVAGVLALGARILAAIDHDLLAPAQTLLLIVVFVAAGTIAHAAWLGGHIRHPEIVSALRAQSGHSGIQKVPNESNRTSRSRDKEDD